MAKKLDTLIVLLKERETWRPLRYFLTTEKRRFTQEEQEGSLAVDLTLASGRQARPSPKWRGKRGVKTL